MSGGKRLRRRARARGRMRVRRCARGGGRVCAGVHAAGLTPGLTPGRVCRRAGEDATRVYRRECESTCVCVWCARMQGACTRGVRVCRQGGLRVCTSSTCVCGRGCKGTHLPRHAGVGASTFAREACARTRVCAAVRVWASPRSRGVGWGCAARGTLAHACAGERTRGAAGGRRDPGEPRGAGGRSAGSVARPLGGAAGLGPAARSARRRCLRRRSRESAGDPPGPAWPGPAVIGRARGGEAPGAVPGPPGPCPQFGFAAKPGRGGWSRTRPGAGLRIIES